MIGAITILLSFQLLGEIIARLLELPIPGPVIGMALLFLALSLRGKPSENLRQTAGQLLQHLSLLFIPAGTGVMVYAELIRKEWLPLGVALFGSTVLAIVVTALVLRLLARRHPQSAVEDGQ